MTDVPGPIPVVDDQELAAVASFLPQLPNMHAELADRFAQAVRALIEKRAQQSWPNEQDADFAVFVMVDHPRRVGEKLGASPFADLSAKDEPLFGRLFLVNHDASAGRVMSMPTDSNAILEWLDEKGFGRCPIVTVYRKSKELLTRRAGTTDRARTDAIRERRPSATLPELEAALDHYHRTRLLTPLCCPPGVWKPKSAQKYIPGPQPERTIQNDLTLALNFWFHGVVRAECEDTTNVGRIDIRLLKKSGSTSSLTYWVIMELKVVKSYTSPTTGHSPSPVSEVDNVNGIVEGVHQVGSFTANRYAEDGMLEVYDLRRDKTNNLTNRAEVSSAIRKFTPCPEIHVWPVFGSSSDARKAGHTGV